LQCLGSSNVLVLSGSMRTSLSGTPIGSTRPGPPSRRSARHQDALHLPRP
jgi:hypothetical protein